MLQLISRFNRLPVWRRSVRLWGSAMVPSSLDRLLSLVLHRAGWMGRGSLAVFRAHVREGMCVVDAGANQGIYTLLLSRLAGPNGRVWAFEPEPALYACALENCRRNRAHNVELRQFALGSRSGRLSLAASVVNMGDNRMARGPASRGGVPVEVRPLDELVEGRVDFVKMDVQGWEFEVLRGMARILAENPRIALYFEFWPQGLREAGEDPGALLQYLEELGFLLREVRGGGTMQAANRDELLARLNGVRYTNILAVRPLD